MENWNPALSSISTAVSARKRSCLLYTSIEYKNAEGKDKEAAETADEVEFDKEVTMYVVNDVYVRAEANGDSEALAVASLGQDVTVTGAAPKWYKVVMGETTGYIARSFLSMSLIHI